MSKLILVAVVMNAVAVAVVGFSRAGIPKDFWPGRTSLVVWAIVTTAVAPIVLAWIAERGERRQRRLLQQQTKLEPFLTAALIQLHRDLGVDWETTGVQVFAKQGWWWWKRHRRLAKVRLSPVPSSGIVWSAGKGAIGRCWETGAPHAVDLAAHFAPYESIHTEEAWNTIPPRDRYGLTFNDFQRLKDKYGFVAVTPIVRKDKYVGCVTADIPPGGPNLSGPAVITILSGTAHLVGVGELV